MKFSKPFVGRVAGFHVSRGVGYIDWEPGNGVRYVVHAVELNDEVAQREGGRVLVALGPCEMSAYVLNPENASILEAHYIQEKFRLQSFTEQDLTMVTALLNWVLLGESGHRYAAEVWNEMRKKFRHLNLVAA